MSFTSWEWELSYSFRDNNGDYATTSFVLPNALTEAEAVAVAEAIATPLAALSNAYLRDFTLSKTFITSAVDGLDPTSEVLRKLAIRFTDANERKSSIIQVPSPVWDIEVNGTNMVPLTDTLVAALVGAVAGFSAGNGPVVSGNLDIAKALWAEVTHRNSTRRSR